MSTIWFYSNNFERYSIKETSSTITIPVCASYLLIINAIDSFCYSIWLSSFEICSSVLEWISAKNILSFYNLDKTRSIFGGRIKNNFYISSFFYFSLLHSNFKEQFIYKLFFYKIFILLCMQNSIYNVCVGYLRNIYHKYEFKLNFSKNVSINNFSNVKNLIVIYYL